MTLPGQGVLLLMGPYLLAQEVLALHVGVVLLVTLTVVTLTAVATMTPSQVALMQEINLFHLLCLTFHWATFLVKALVTRQHPQ